MRYSSLGFYFTQIRPVWEGDFGSRPKNSKTLWLEPYFYLFISKFFLAMSVGILKRMLSFVGKKSSFRLLLYSLKGTVAPD
jgi:hypothetical protein